MNDSQSGLRTSIIIFGATGDLTHRKLFPSIYQLFLEGMLPEEVELIGFARRDKDDLIFRQEVEASVKQFSRTPVEEASWQVFARKIFYHQSSFDDLAGYERLRERLEGLERSDQDAPEGEKRNLLFYLAAGPDQFPVILENLKASRLDAFSLQGESKAWRRLIVEKPFGTSLATAHELNKTVHAAFPESMTYRIDHYLGKEASQNIMAFRFANPIVEAFWNHRFIEKVEIVASESLGVEGRGGYYDHAGALRDMIQNHLLQLFSLVAMEAPQELSADAVRDQKCAVLSAVKPWEERSLQCDVVRGQYAAVEVGGVSYLGYREEDRVAPDSTTETYAGLRLYLETERWKGVPFLLRAGKRMATSSAEVIVTFKKGVGMFASCWEGSEGSQEAKSHDSLRTRLVLRIQPDAGWRWETAVKVPGEGMHLTVVPLEGNYASAFEKAIPEAYERLILDTLRGDATLFARSDEVEAAWSLIDPIEEKWAASQEDLQFYPCGSEGPSFSEKLLK